MAAAALRPRTRLPHTSAPQHQPATAQFRAPSRRCWHLCSSRSDAAAPAEESAGRSSPRGGSSATTGGSTRGGGARRGRRTQQRTSDADSTAEAAASPASNVASPAVEGADTTTKATAKRRGRPPKHQAAGQAEAAAAATAAVAVTAPAAAPSPPAAESAPPLASHSSAAGSPAAPTPAARPSRSAGPSISTAAAAASILAAAAGSLDPSPSPPASTPSASTSAPTQRPSFGPEPPSASPPSTPPSLPSAPAPSPSTARTAVPFGPEPPPPAPEPSQLTTATLPNDPSELSVEDILDLPLPDPRVGEDEPADNEVTLGDGDGDGPAGLGSVAQMLRRMIMDEQQGQGAGPGEGEAAAGVVEEQEEVRDEEVPGGDLDYDQLIALAQKVDAARYVERAFERARQGLEPLAAEEGGQGQAGGQGGMRPESARRVVEQIQQRPGAAKGQQQQQQDQKRSAPWGSSWAGRARAPSATASTTASAPAAPSPTESTASSSWTPPPTVMAEYVDVPDSSSSANPQANTQEEEDPEMAFQRRAALLVDLMSSSGAELEAKLVRAAPQVDEELIHMLHARYNTALRMGQDEQMLHHLAQLYSTLKYMYQRAQSTPAERLLDDVLEILSGAGGQPDPERRQAEAAARLHNAFTGGMLELDIFEAAEALAGQNAGAAEALAVEQVEVDVFKGAAMELLSHAKKVQAETQAAVEEVLAVAERVRKEEGEAALQGPEWRARMEQVRLAQAALEDREDSIMALEEVLLVTRAVEKQILTGMIRARR